MTVVVAVPPLPTPEAFANLAGSLVGKKVKATKSTAPLLAANIRGVASYVDANGDTRFVAVADVAQQRFVDVAEPMAADQRGVVVRQLWRSDGSQALSRTNVF